LENFSVPTDGCTLVTEDSNKITSGHFGFLRSFNWEITTGTMDSISLDSASMQKEFYSSFEGDGEDQYLGSDPELLQSQEFLHDSDSEVKMQNYLHVLHHRITIFIVSSPWLMQSST
jgi:hypothetical protein